MRYKDMPVWLRATAARLGTLFLKSIALLALINFLPAAVLHPAWILLFGNIRPKAVAVVETKGNWRHSHNTGQAAIPTEPRVELCRSLQLSLAPLKPAPEAVGRWQRVENTDTLSFQGQQLWPGARGEETSCSWLHLSGVELLLCWAERRKACKQGVGWDVSVPTSQAYSHFSYWLNFLHQVFLHLLCP